MGMMNWMCVVVAIVLLVIVIELIRSWHRVRRRARYTFYSVLDAQSRPAKPGVAYLYADGRPGSDRTTIVVDEVRGDGTVAGYDVNSGARVDRIEAHLLWRPMVNTWNAHPVDRDAVIAHAGESPLNLD